MAAGPTKVSVAGFAAMKDAVAKATGDVFLLFCGGKDAGTGTSWCPDCVSAEPVVAAAAAAKLTGEQTFVHVDVGDRAAWKAADNAFRTDPDLRLTGVPTLLKWGAFNNRLVEAQCLKNDLVEMLFDE